MPGGVCLHSERATCGRILSSTSTKTTLYTGICNGASIHAACRHEVTLSGRLLNFEEQVLMIAVATTATVNLIIDVDPDDLLISFPRATLVTIGRSQ